MKKVKYKIRHRLAFFKPLYWVMNYNYSKVWETKLTHELLKGTEFTDIGEYTAKLGPYTIWIANHPYASFSPHKIDVRPSRKMISFLHDKICNDLLKELE